MSSHSHCHPFDLSSAFSSFSSSLFWPSGFDHLPWISHRSHSGDVPGHAVSCVLCFVLAQTGLCPLFFLCRVDPVEHQDVEERGPPDSESCFIQPRANGTWLGEGRTHRQSFLLLGHLVKGFFSHLLSNHLQVVDSHQMMAGDISRHLSTWTKWRRSLPFNFTLHFLASHVHR